MTDIDMCMIGLAWIGLDLAWPGLKRSAERLRSGLCARHYAPFCGSGGRIRGAGFVGVWSIYHREEECKGSWISYRCLAFRVDGRKKEEKEKKEGWGGGKGKRRASEK